ncbi:NB-ARC domain, LRR domain containing protein [Parasponia andersonii]|uniref:NB-ARC domain, LRR domain containing protein n=1 Tax=Parasponia andersonii TaxID=3476 RepID=A0A2P5ATA5_PARAD|nr:NB-ARC domain, LRR domain containing protein [Parasponia andersonii]
MAELALSAVLQVIFDKLASFGLDKSESILDFKANVEKLQRTLTRAQALLDDAEEKQVTKQAVRRWLSDLKDLAYDAEALLLGLPADDSLKERIQADKVKDMLLSLEKAVDQGRQYSLSVTAADTGHGQWERGMESDSSVIESEVYGREEDKKRLVKLLLSTESTQERGGTGLCIPIIGMGGLGKTTLATLAYNDHRVERRFDVKVWIFVSHQSDVKDILIRIIESITEAKWELSAMEAAHKKVRKLFLNKRYLIVLDDVWIEDKDDWDRLRSVLFEAGIDGSRILITARSGKVVDALIRTGFPTIRYDLEELSEEACWSLFKHRAFDRGEEENHPSLLAIGEQIVRKCGGLALATKALGSLLRFKRDIEEWEFIRDSELWDLDVSESEILPALRLSYSRLPLHLKRCLEFCSIFPRSYEFNKEKLIRQWMAHGLIKSRSEREQKKRKSQLPSVVYLPMFGLEVPMFGTEVPMFGTEVPMFGMEDIGFEYFNELEWMSFFQETKQCKNGIVIRYKMHDIIYDLLQSVTSSEYTILGRGFATPTSFKRIRHSSVICDFRSATVPEELYEAGHHLRTLLVFSEGNLEVLPKKFYTSFTCLFVLNMSGSGLIELESSIGALSHLTYLDLSLTHIQELPPEIEDLPLQTLNLFNCYNLVALPNLLKMKTVRHLNNEGCRRLTYMFTPVRRKKIRNMRESNLFQLRTLPLFVIGGDFDANFLCRLRLRGSLKITHLENIFKPSRIKPLYFNLIKSLGLYWGSDDGAPNINPEEESVVSRFQERKEIESAGPSREVQQDSSKGEEVLGHLKLPYGLERLLIKGYPGLRFNFSCWVCPHLKVLNLINCRRIAYFPFGWNLQSLTSISLREMHGVTHIDQEFFPAGTKNPFPFPLLDEFIAVDLPNLKKWLSPDTGGNAFPNLRKLVLNKCPELTVIPQILSLHHLDLRGTGNATLVDSFQNLTSLETLVTEGIKDLHCFPGTFPISNPHLTSWEIKSCPELSSLPKNLENLAALKSLVICQCEKLESLPTSLQLLSSLESLEIDDCCSLTSLPDVANRGLSNLRSLSILNCDMLASLSMGFQHLTSLEILTIMRCPRIVALPQTVQHLSALRSLSILWCDSLKLLPEELQNLTVLQSLEIGSCPGLTVLPEWIGKLVSLRSLVISYCHMITVLPEAMRGLTALQHLSIQGCHVLQHRCRPEIGIDWPKIAHIPYKHIESPNLKRPREEEASSSNL